MVVNWASVRRGLVVVILIIVLKTQPPIPNQRGLITILIHALGAQPPNLRGLIIFLIIVVVNQPPVQ